MFPTRLKRSIASQGKSQIEADDPKAHHPAKRLRENAEASLGSFEGLADEPLDGLVLPLEPPLLCEHDSQALQAIFDEVMASSASQTLKRPSAKTHSETPTGRTSGTNNNVVYRSYNLMAAGVHLHADPPDDIKAIITSIVEANVHERHQSELRRIAQAFRQACHLNVKALKYEDDFLLPLITAIPTLCAPKPSTVQKAPWKQELKLASRQLSQFDFSLVATAQPPNTDNPSVTNVQGPPPKISRRLSSSSSSLSSRDITASEQMPPPPRPPRPPLRSTSVGKATDSGMLPPQPVFLGKDSNTSPVKTPFPDLTVGLPLRGLLSALAAQKLDPRKAHDFILQAEREKLQFEADGPLEPMLIVQPAVGATDIVFPFLVVEGKAYSTGKQIFEAENQAAVAMACAHKILISLDRVAGQHQCQPHVLFSVTTVGPIHELWAHWTTLQGDQRDFESQLWGSWNVLLEDRAEDFIVKLHNVCAWGTRPFMTSVVESLRRAIVRLAV